MTEVVVSSSESSSELESLARGIRSGRFSESDSESESELESRGRLIKGGRSSVAYESDAHESSSVIWICGNIGTECSTSLFLPESPLRVA